MALRGGEESDHRLLTKEKSGQPGWADGRRRPHPARTGRYPTHGVGSRAAARAGRAHRRGPGEHPGGISRSRGIAFSGRIGFGRNCHRDRGSPRHREVATLSRIEHADVAAEGSAGMTRNVHDEARELIALGGDLSETQQTWLWAHLHECEGCRHYAEAANGVVRGLRSLPLAADPRLVRATQMRVRFDASRLRETRERLWLGGRACLGVGLSATLTVPLLWRLFAWMGAG